eukprot:scaffold15415_cov63-Phaeocystis_antarctica.AAC.3
MESTWGAPHGTQYVRHARGWHVSILLTVVPRAVGTHRTQEAGTRSPYVAKAPGREHRAAPLAPEPRAVRLVLADHRPVRLVRHRPVGQLVEPTRLPPRRPAQGEARTRE